MTHSSLKVGVLCSGLGRVARGVETWADVTASALHERGVDVTLFKAAGATDRPFDRLVPCAYRGGRFAHFMANATPACAWRIGCRSPYDVEQTTFALSVLPRLCTGRFDILHLQDPWLAWCLERTRRLHGAAVILGNGTEEPHWFLRRFRHIQELSPYYLQRHGDLGDRQWFAIPNSVDARRFRRDDPAAARARLGIPADAFVVLCVAALNRSRKRVDWIVHEFQRAALDNAILLLAGAEEAETADLLQEAEALLGDRVIIMRDVPYTDMPRLYQAADVHVLAALQEVLGISLLEAMSTGIPCIGHHWPATEWVIGDGGSIVDMETSGALASELARYQNVPFHSKRAQLARQRVENVFSCEAVVSQYIDMYDAVCGAGSEYDNRSAPVEACEPAGAI